MSSRNIIYACCLLGALVAVACGTEDDSAPPPNGSAGTVGSSGKGNSAGSSGKGSVAGSSGKGGAASGGDSNPGNGGSGVGDAGEGGEGGGGNGCVPLSKFVHTVFTDDTNATAAPRPVNNVVFCDDPADPAAYSDLF